MYQFNLLITKNIFIQQPLLSILLKDKNDIKLVQYLYIEIKYILIQ